MKYVGRRLGLFVVTLWVALTVNFAIPRVMPGNEATAVLATFHGVNPSAMHALEIEFGVNAHQSLLASVRSVSRQLVYGQLWPQRGPHPGAAGHPQQAAVDSGSRRRDDGIGVSDRNAARSRQRVVSRWRLSIPSSRRFCSSPPACPVFFVALVLIYVFAVTLGWLPLGSNTSLGATPSLSLSFVGRRARACTATGNQPHRRDGGAVDLLDAKQHDLDPVRGLRQDGACKGYKHAADHVRLCRAKCDPAESDRVCDAARPRSRRSDPGRVHVFVSRVSVTCSLRAPPSTICR